MLRGGRARPLAAVVMAGLVCAVVLVGASSQAQLANDVGALNAELVRLHEAGKYREATEIAKRVLTILEKTLGPDHAEVGTSLNKLAVLYYTQGNYAEAEPLYRRSLAIIEKARGPEHPLVGTALNNLAELCRTHGRYPEAEPLYRRSLAIREMALGREHPDVATSLNNLALLYEAQGRYVEAEPLYRRSLAIREKMLGPEHPHVGTTLNNLAGLYQAQSRTAEAEPLYRRALAMAEKALGPEHPLVGTALNNLAQLYWAQGRHAEAEPLHRRSLTIIEKTLGPEHPHVGGSLSNLALLYQAQGRHSEAELLYRRSLAIREKALGREHPDVATSLNNLALLYQAQGRHAEAEPLYRRSLAIREKILGPEHPHVGTTLSNLAVVALARGDWAEAANTWRRSTGVIERRAQRGLSGAAAGSAKGEAQRWSWQFAGLIKTTHRLAAQGRVDFEAQALAMFETAQWAQGSEAAASLAQMAARSAKGSPELGLLVREWQDLVSEWQAKDKQLIGAKSEEPVKRNATAEKALSDRLVAIDTRLTEINARLTNDFPDYAALASTAPMSVAEVQAQLGVNEALVLFFDTPEWKMMASNSPPEETFVWVITRTQVRWLRSELGKAALGREVAALRCGLDANAWSSKDFDCSKLTGISYSETDHATGKPLPFDAVRAHALYKGLLGEATELIQGKHLLVVLSGALTTLPFQVLVTEVPKSKHLAAARWLIRDHAITVLPSVASLRALRRTGKPSTAPKPMIGFANPLLDGDQQDSRYGAWYKQQAQRARAETGCAIKPEQRTVTLRAISRSASPVPLTAGLADLAHLRKQTPLPETADEVCDVARRIGANVSDMRIGARATETEVKRLSDTGELATYGIVHFATHGLLAGQLSGTREPGLILTPPVTTTPQDDGYLSGSEIAGLKLNADWVILSACNTAGGAGQGEAAEALSGLARVFFYAGARALLVSHWEVDSNAAVKLVTGAIGALAKDKGIGRAEALRRAVLAVMADTTRPAHWVPASHPSVWAPFVVVGEGGAGR